MLGYEDTDNVYPAHEETHKRHYQADDEPERAALFEERRPAHDYLGYPVHAGNEQQYDLHQAALLVEPRHGIAPPFL